MKQGLINGEYHLVLSEKEMRANYQAYRQQIIDYDIFFSKTGFDKLQCEEYQTLINMAPKVTP